MADKATKRIPHLESVRPLIDVFVLHARWQLSLNHLLARMLYCVHRAEENIYITALKL
jgi:hypothetical protein